MKRLNNHGWSFREMIFILCGLFLALGVAIYYIHILYGEYDKNEKITEKISKNNKNEETKEKENEKSNESEVLKDKENITTNYEILEKKLSQSALNYVVDLNDEIAQDFSLTVTLNELKINNYLDNLIEEENKSECDGYAIIYAKEGSLYSDPYITCSNYQTPDFESWRLD